MMHDQISRPRQGGKTEAMLHRIGELQDEYGDVTIICFTLKEAKRVSGIIYDRFYELKIDPSRVTVHSVATATDEALRCQSGALVIDNVDMASRTEVDRLCESGIPLVLTTFTED